MIEKFDQEFIEKTRHQFKTQSHKKIVHFINNLVADLEFQKRIKNLRYKYKIPKNGLKSRIITLLPPGKLNSDIIKNFRKDLMQISLDYDLNPVDFSDVFACYILSNEIEYPIGPIAGYNLIDFISTQDECENCKEMGGNSVIQEENKVFPIAIRISPYATLTDIRNYLKEMYNPFIKPLQEIYKKKNILIGKIRARDRNILKRNNLVYSLHKKGLPLKEISAKLDDLDEGAIGKIISLMKKEKEV